MGSNNLTTIALKRETYLELQAICGKGRSYDSLVREMLDVFRGAKE